MPSPSDVASLVALTSRDGMVVRRVYLPAAEVAYFKALVEASEGLAVIHAEEPADPADSERELVVACSSECEGALDRLLRDAAREIALRCADAAPAEAASVEEVPEDLRLRRALRPLEPHVFAAWKAWLCSLANDAEAATAAAHLYAEMPPEARDKMLDALAEDAPTLEVPFEAVFGPLLAVEDDPRRQARVRELAGTALGPVNNVKRALLAIRAGERLAALVIPLYLDFVRVLVCRFHRERGFTWVRQDPIVREAEAPVRGTVIEGFELLPSSTDAVIDELAHAVLAHRRLGLEVPRVLRDCSDLFSARAYVPS